MVIQIQSDVTITKATGNVSCVLTVPAKDDSKGFTDAIRNQVVLSSIVGYADISTAASIKPVTGPELGVPGDFSQSARTCSPGVQCVRNIFDPLTSTGTSGVRTACAT